MTRIIVDSTCDLPQNLLDKYGIIMVPMFLTIGSEEYHDKVDIKPSAVYDAMRAGIVPKTAQIDLDCLSAEFESCCREGSDFIYLAFSSVLSCTCQSARIVLQEFTRRYPGLKMTVVDSKGGSMSTGLIALQAARMLESGYGYDEVLAAVQELVEHTEHIFTLFDLKWLVKGGRIDPIKGTIGSLLNVKPIIHVKNGSMDIIKKVRGSNNAVTALIETVAERIRDFPDQLVAVAHAGNLQGAEALLKRITERIGAKSFIVSEIGSSLATHIGIGALGVFFFNKRTAHYIK